jgi:hypothetical protein
MGRPLPPEFAAGAGPALSIHLDDIEVTQVIQDLAHSVPLVAGKATVVRVYLSVPAGTPPSAVRGEISVKLDGGGAAQSVASINAATIRSLPAGGLRQLREDLAASLNFSLPAELLGARQITITLANLVPSSGGSAIFSPQKSVTVKLHVTPPLRVKLIGLRYREPASGTTHVPSERDFQLTSSWLRRTYPVAEVQVARLTTDIPNPWPFECDDANLFLAALRRQDLAAGGDPRVHYFGLVSDGAGFMRGCASDVPDHPAPDTVASGPAGSNSWGWDNDGSYADWYTGHELGHTFGRRHPGFCNGNSADDPQFPYPNGQLSKNDGSFVGFDVGDSPLGVPMAVAPGQTWHDVMTYCERQWMCAYTFTGILDRLMTEDQQFAPAPIAPPGAAVALDVAPDRLIHVLASVELVTGAVRIYSVQPVARGQVSRVFSDSEAVVEVLDATGAALVSRPIRVKKSTCCEGHEEHGMIDALLPAPAGSREVRILWRGNEAARWRSEAAASPTAAAAAVGGSRERYFVQVRRDASAPWETVATQLSSPDYAIDGTLFPGVTHLAVRVLATDGFASRVVREETRNLAE